MQSVHIFPALENRLKAPLIAKKSFRINANRLLLNRTDDKAKCQLSRVTGTVWPLLIAPRKIGYHLSIFSLARYELSIWLQEEKKQQRILAFLWRLAIGVVK